MGFLSGALVGAAQWVVLRSRVLRAGRWVLATAAAVGIAHALGDGAPISLATSVAIAGGLALGAAQWLVLRHLGAGARWWIAGTFATWYVGLAGGLRAATALGLMDLGGPAGWAMQHAFVGAVMGVLYGSVTGVVLVRLYPRGARRPARSSAPTEV